MGFITRRVSSSETSFVAETATASMLHAAALNHLRSIPNHHEERAGRSGAISQVPPHTRFCFKYPVAPYCTVHSGTLLWTPDLNPSPTKRPSSPNPSCARINHDHLARFSTMTVSSWSDESMNWTIRTRSFQCNFPISSLFPFSRLVEDET
jgi:hypothetical protein